MYFLHKINFGIHLLVNTIAQKYFNDIFYNFAEALYKLITGTFDTDHPKTAATPHNDSSKKRQSQILEKTKST